MDKSGKGREEMQATLVESLMRAAAYPHPVASLELFKTHISWVILTGPFAYKIKKAVKLEFLDFSTLELRKHFCDEELRLNRRWAPELYLDVVPIGGTWEAPVVAGAGPPIEYAVKMKQFEQDSQLDRQLMLDRLSEQDMYNLAETIHGYHERAVVIPLNDESAAVDDVLVPMFDNFPPLKPVVDEERLDRIYCWTETSLQQLTPDLVERRASGFVRECHGDLHLTNLVRLPSGIVPYDCVEFSPELRVMDVLSDLSFLVMDLFARGRGDLAFVLLNRYLEKSGDYAGTPVFGLYLVYHCMIRAKVAAIRNTERSLKELENRLAAAIGWIDRPPTILIAMHGLSASGKTWLSSRVVAKLPALRVRSDIERKRLHGLGELESSGSAVAEGIYTQTATSRVYEHMMKAAEALLVSGFNVILDASFLKRAHRDAAERLARRHGVGFAILETTTSVAELERRLRDRAETKEEVSEAGQDVLHYQMRDVEPLREAERRYCISVDTGVDIDIDTVLERLKIFQVVKNTG